MSQPPFRIVFVLYPGVTHLDFTGPHQVLARLPGAVATVASVDGGEMESDGLTFAHLSRLADIEACDLLCVPGGLGSSEAMHDAAFMAQIKRLAAGAKYVTSVCTGSLILGAAGLLKGRRAACHWAWRDQLALFGAIPDPARVVRDGNIFTGGGVTAGIDFALTVAAEVAGPLVAQSIQLSIEYAPQPPFDAGRPDLASPEVLALVEQRMGGLMPARRAAAEAAALAMT
ncbi:MAG: thiamine biosynthesis protein ThiJ [Caulobacter sp.]|nr:thiamine biosynthesis protein ThiJ [Caulobacter sp.]